MSTRIQSKLIVPPQVEPVTVAEAKHYGLDAPDDVTIEKAIKAARELAEGWTGRAFMEQTWRAVIYGVVSGKPIELPRSGLVEVVSVLDASGNVIVSDDYEIDKDCEPGLIQFSASHNKVVVEYKAATWGDVIDVPEYVKQALSKAAFLIHDNRASSGLPDVARADLLPLKISFLG